jgi:hypothetical protein
LRAFTQLLHTQQQIASKAHSHAGDHAEQYANPTIPDSVDPRLVDYPRGQYHPARQHIGGIAAAIRIDEPRGRRADNIGIGDQRGHAPVGEQRREDRCGRDDGGFEDLFVHI